MGREGQEESNYITIRAVQQEHGLSGINIYIYIYICREVELRKALEQKLLFQEREIVTFDMLNDHRDQEIRRLHAIIQVSEWIDSMVGWLVG